MKLQKPGNGIPELYLKDFKEMFIKNFWKSFD